MEKIKVIFIITRMIKGGAQNFALLIYRSLNREKYEITFASGPSTGPEGDYLSELNAHGLNYKIIPSLTRDIHPIKDLKAFFEILALMREIKPTIVHTHTSKAGVLGRIAAKILKVPVTIHQPHGLALGEAWQVLDTPQIPLIRRLLTTLEKVLAKFTDKFITYTQVETDEHLYYRIGKREQFVVIPYGLDVEKFADKVTYVARGTLENRPPIIGTVGRLVTSKGHRYLIEAMELVKKSVPDIKLFVVGDGFLRKKLDSMVKKLGLADNIQFLGVVDNIAEFLSGIDIFVLPTLYESFGIVLIEAQACKKPVVVSDVGSIREVIKNGQTGLLVPPKNPRAIADAIIRLIRDKQLSKRLGEAGF
ncbi:MAG: hypothetical protein AMJ78_04645 [Omnitrophica WOR_2 bacterium SM23_29]|nr:MAG: hypothetical protein AMJ78_04645 [Omnitrophica WOR_2 bacterium SM23_29]